jgi:hypothetical protein
MSECLKLGERWVTREQVQSKKDKAVRFVANVLGDPDRADEIDNESIEDYASRKRLIISNPRRNTSMAKTNGRTKEQLLDEIDDLQQENQDLQDRLDAICDMASGDEDEDEDDGDDDAS